MTEQEESQYLQYVATMNPPVEADFFTSKQMEELKKEKEKLANTSRYIESVLKTDDFEDKIEKSVIEGKIYSASQYNHVARKIKAYEEGDGTRIDTPETLVTKTGQRIIMSNRLADTLGFFTDGYVLRDDLDELTSALESDGVPGPIIDRVVSAMHKYGAIVLQNGIFEELKPMLEEAIGHSLIAKPLQPAPVNTRVLVDKPVTPMVTQQPRSLTELPISFIEYLKHNDKEYSRVEHEVATDPLFLDFFSNLKNHFAYYKSLTTERMAGEVIVRPQLWIKLSPKTRAWVQNIVDRNRDKFVAKIDQIAQTTNVAKLDELKKTLAK